MQKKHSFSSKRYTDTFVLTVRGNSMFTSTVVLEVLSPRGVLLYTDQFTMDIFRAYGSTENKGNDSEDSSEVMNRLTHLFDEGNFYSPAIGDTSEMENNTVPRGVWWDIWLDRSAISFHYRISMENGRGIVYSKKRSKVIQYYICC